MHMLFGYYFGRTVIIFLLAFTQFQTMQQQSDYYTSDEQYIDNLLEPDWVVGITTGTKHGKSYVCVQDEFASFLLVTVVTEFLLPKLTYLAKVGGKYLLFVKIRKGERKREPFELEKNVCLILYIQSILWLLQPLYPLSALLGPILLLGHFKFEKFYLLRYCNKSTASSSTSSESMFQVSK